MIPQVHGNADRTKLATDYSGSGGRKAGIEIFHHGDSPTDPAASRRLLRISSAARQTNAIAAASVLPETGAGMTEQSTTRRLVTPRTRNSASTTASASPPILQFATACAPHSDKASWRRLSRRWARRRLHGGQRTLPGDVEKLHYPRLLEMHRVPLMLALSAELPEPGGYKAMEVMGLPVLITRDASGTIHAFLNVCQHRGAPVIANGTGKCSRFTCLYHGWTYSNDGRLLAVTDGKNFGEIDKSQRSLTALPCAERAGMIFVGLTPGAGIDVEGFYGGMLDDFEAADLAHWTFLGSRVIEGANWKIAFDGYLEGYHFATLHPQTIALRTLSNVTHYEAFGPHLRIGFPQKDIAKLRELPRGQWGQRENFGFDFVRILFPNVSAFLAPEIAQIAQLFPGPTPDTNRTVLLYARRTPPADDADKAHLEQMINFLRDVTYKEDYVLGGQIQQGLQSGGVKNLVFGRNERGNQFFHEVVEWYLAEDPSLPMPVL